MLSETTETTQRNVKAGNDKKKPVRRDPEKRRQQNVQAQRKYREKLRERLDKLETLAASAAQSRAAGTAIAGAPVLSQEVASATEAVAALPSISTPPTTASPQPSTSVTSQSISSPFPNTQLHIKTPYNPWDAYPGPSIITLPWSPPLQQQLTPQSDDTSSSSELSIWDPSMYIDRSYLMPSKSSNNNARSWGLDCTLTVDCGCSSEEHSHILSRGMSALNRGEFKIITFGPIVSAGPADPYTNNIRLEAICTLSAIAALGSYIGITQEVLCADESLSPFFRPGAAATPSSTVETVQRIFKTLKPDLRPSREQITVEHHPYIDILPFPTLRKNLIREQKGLDEDEFFEDILTGLVCWGGAGVGQRDRAANTGYVSTGSPWDVRSWEARAWFAKKYWNLLGGDEGELVRQSEWYRGVRGEGSLVVEVGC
ncbi:hypothetical protein GE09DRAFT_955278 [Coniochaeta sp. 2T2.1]|nr:hypothetical protein GE09DRAFT_955278 [Coniochaeta sp. 2T2.1]